MTTKLIILVVISLQLIACEKEKTTGLSADIALYSDNGCWAVSVTAATNMFLWMGYTVELVNSEYINEKGLNDFKLLCIPGGDMYQYSNDLSSSGIEKIRDFISHGGGYIGICGGAYFAGEKVFWQENQLNMESLGLFNGITKGPINEIVTYPDSIMCKLLIDTLHPITKSEPDTAWILYYWGPALITEDTSIYIIGKYDIVDLPSILAFNYQNGRVFLIGTHPEIEENSDRDGIIWNDDLFDDKGSDWDLMKKATDWCIMDKSY